VACPTCKGNPKVRRLTPDFAKALSLGPLWDEVIMARCGRWYFGLENRPEDKRRLFLEYPSGGRCWEERRAVCCCRRLVLPPLHSGRAPIPLLVGARLMRPCCCLPSPPSPRTAAVERPIELPAPRPFIAEQMPPKPDDKPGLGSKPSGWASRSLNVEDYVVNYASGGWGPCAAVLGAGRGRGCCARRKGNRLLLRPGQPAFRVSLLGRGIGASRSLGPWKLPSVRDICH
jgi:hypothetical protein